MTITLKWKGSRFQHGDVDICWSGLCPGEGWAGHDVLHSAPDPVLGHHHHDQHRLRWHRPQVGNVPQTLDERVVMTTLSAVTLTAACSSFVWQVFTSNSGHLLASSWRRCAPSAVFSASHCPSRSLWQTSTGIIFNLFMLCSECYSKPCLILYLNTFEHWKLYPFVMELIVGWNHSPAIKVSFINSDI